MDAPKRDNTTPSCTVCQRRKVKCNRVYPCAPCQKTGLECSFPPQEARHRPKRIKRSSLSERSRQDRETTLGATTDTATSSAQRASEQPLPPTAPTPNTARLISDGGGYRYVNNHLWNAVSSPTATATDGSTPGTLRAVTLRSPDGRSGDSIYENAVQLGSEIAAGSADERRDLLVGQYPGLLEGRSFIFNRPHSDRSVGATSATNLRLPPGHITQLWQAYIQNIDPIMKIFHVPTVQHTVLGQLSRPALAANEEALMSAIYLISAVSLDDDECRSSLQECRDELVRRFRRETEDALSAAGFVTTSDITVLQAFVLYLVALRSLGETPTVWAMSGLAIRIAGTIGLARDGSVLGLPPFECEMRRRLWWAIVYLDARTAELVGQDGDLLVQNYDVRPPSNMNDSELFQNMRRIPEGRPASTDMIYVQLRVTLAICLRALPGASGPAGTWQRIRALNVPVSEKLDIVESLERKFEDEILRYCDATVPLQLFTANSAQTFLYKLRLVGNVPLSRDSLASSEPDGKYSDNIFEWSMRLMQLQLDLWTEPCLQKWRWHWGNLVQWYAIAELIRQTRLRQPGPVTMKAWGIIRNVFDIIIPSLELGTKSPLLEPIRALLNTATGGQAQATGTQAKPAHITSQPANTFSPTDRSASAMQVPRLSVPGLGSNPHSALLPAIASPTKDSTASGQSEVDMAAFDDSMLGLDFGAIDWVEFDRLTNELCGQ